jgi:hypothetical protein
MTYQKKENSSEYDNIIQNVIFSVEEKILINRITFLTFKDSVHNFNN